jgi:hypothetical protein
MAKSHLYLIQDEIKISSSQLGETRYLTYEKDGKVSLNVGVFWLFPFHHKQDIG